MHPCGSEDITVVALQPFGLMLEIGVVGLIIYSIYWNTRHFWQFEWQKSVQSCSTIGDQMAIAGLQFELPGIRGCIYWEFLVVALGPFRIVANIFGFVFE